VQKIDINALLVKVDINALIERSDLEAIVAQSSSGVFTGIMDTLRFQIVRMDLFLLKMFQFGKAILPPAPGMVDTHTPFPKTTTAKAMAVQLHYCGIFSKTLAIGCDAALLFIVQTTFTLALEAAVKRVNKLLIQWDPDLKALGHDEFVISSILNFLSAFFYLWIAVALTGQTIGMAVVGIRVVNINGDQDISPLRAAYRTTNLVGTILTWPFAILAGLYRRDGRMPHDIIARTGIIFKWNARMARLREKQLPDDDSTVSSQGSMNPQQGSDADTASGGNNATESSDQDDESDKTGTSNKNAAEKTDQGKSNSKEMAISRRSLNDKPPAVKEAKGSTRSTPRSSMIPPESAKADALDTEKQMRGYDNSVRQQKMKGNDDTVPHTIMLTPESVGEDSANATLSAATSTPPTSQLRQALDASRNDLQNVKPPGVIAFFFNPIRGLVLDPSLAIAGAVAPPVFSAIPFADGIAATGVRIPFEAAKLAYGLLPYRQDAQEVDLALVAQNDILCTPGAGYKAAPQLTASDSLQSLITVSHALGITLGDSLGEKLVRNSYGGRLPEDMEILQKIQEEYDQRLEVGRYQQSQIQDEINEGSRMMKFATAAYGTGMLQCDLERDAGVQKLHNVKKEIAQHVDICEGDIKLVCMSEGANTKLLRHFVAIDRKSNSVILAIRGSLSIVGARIGMRADDSK